MPSAPVASPVAAGRPRLILQELAHDDSDVSFQGMRRRLDLHPQALARELRRLEEEGLVERSEGAYRITEEGRAGMAEAKREGERTEILRMLLPADADPSEVAERLAGRWFEGLRWYGRATGPDEVVLLWLTTDGTLVSLRIVAGVASVEVRAGRQEAGAAVVAAQALLSALAAVLGERKPARPKTGTATLPPASAPGPVAS